MIVASKATTTAEAAMPDIARKRSLREVVLEGEGGCIYLEGFLGDILVLRC